jgi:hypothetical protein
LARDHSAALIAVRSDAFDDRVMTALGDAAETRSRTLVSRVDPNERFTFTSYAHLRLANDRLVVEGGLAGFCLHAPRLAARDAVTLNGKPVRYKLSNGYCVYRMSPPAGPRVLKSAGPSPADDADDAQPLRRTVPMYATISKGVKISEDVPYSGVQPEAEAARTVDFKDYVVQSRAYVARINRNSGQIVHLIDKTGVNWVAPPSGSARAAPTLLRLIQADKSLFRWIDKAGEQSVVSDEVQGDRITFVDASGAQLRYTAHEDGIEWELLEAGGRPLAHPHRVKIALLLVRGAVLTWSNGQTLRVAANGIRGPGKQSNVDGLLLQQPRLSRQGLLLRWPASVIEQQYEGGGSSLSLVNYLADDDGSQPQQWWIGFVDSHAAHAWTKR